MNRKGRWGTRIAAVAAALLGWQAGPACADTLLTYPTPPQLMYSAHNDDFTVRVRAPGGEWRDLYEYRVQVDTDTKLNASMVYFDFEGTVELEVMKNNGKFEQVSVAPLSSGIAPQRRGSTLRMTLTKPERFSLQFDDDRLRNLHIVAGAPPPPRPAGDDVVYFGPGFHAPPAGLDHFPVKSGQRVYMAGGAVLKGAFDLDGVTNVKISGRGLLWDPGRAIDLEKAADVEVSDLIIVNSDRKDAARVMNIRNSRNVSVGELTGFSSGKWSDGINISTSQHVKVRDGYLRVSDDAVVVYAVADCPICRQKAAQSGVPAPNPPGDTFDIDVRNMRLWVDVAHALYVGHFGDNSDPRTIRDITFDNIDVANLDEDDPDWEGVIAAYSGDSTLIRNVTFSNIRVDRIEEGKLINIVAGDNPRYNKAPGRGIDGVTLRDITFTGEGMPSPSIIRGLSARTAVKNVTIQNLSIGGKAVRTAQDGDITVSGEVTGLAIR
jgi:hypothetical protein